MPDNKLLYKKMAIEEIIVFSQKEDYKALEELIRRIQKEVYATISYLLHNSEQVNDLTQEVLLKVAKNIAHLKSPKCFKGWLNHIITNTYYDEIRKRKKKPVTIPIEYDCETINVNIKFDIPDPKSKPFEKCITTECEKFIKNAIQNLPEVFKVAIILREFQGLTYEEIAHTTNSSVGTVKSRIARARVKLQEVLKNKI